LPGLWFQSGLRFAAPGRPPDLIGLLGGALDFTQGVLVHPAEVEPWALVINEAAAAGLAIVASDTLGAAAELVRDRENGRIFKAGDLIGLRAAMFDVTIHDNAMKYRAASADVLATWRKRADPVAAVRTVLGNAGFDRPKADKQ